MIDAEAIETVKASQKGDGAKVINFVKSIQKHADENSEDPFLIAMAERARKVQEIFRES